MRENKPINKDIKELVIARLEIMPSNYKLSMNKETFTKDELINHVNAEDLIGNQIVKMQLNYIKALTTGKLIEAINQ